MRKIFISYARKDGTEFAQMLNERLTACGYDVWKDTDDLRIGENVPNGISEAIQNTGEFIVILSPAALVSKWVMDEVDMAISRSSVKILPLVFEGVKNDDVPLKLGVKNYIATKGIDDWQSLDRLVNHLEGGREIPRVYSMSNRDDLKIYGLLLLGKSDSASATLESSADVIQKAEKMWQDFLPYWKNIDKIGIIPNGLAPLANTVLAYMSGKPNQFPRMYYPYRGDDKKFIVSADVYIDLQLLRMKAQTEF
jgi:hypothetical protein